jgi:hypothetical protein
VPPHHWIPLRSSNAKARKDEVEKACDDRKRDPDPPTLQSFWERKGGGQLYAIVQANKLDATFLNAIKKNGPVIEIEDV